jgi:hypothetical protein
MLLALRAIFLYIFSLQLSRFSLLKLHNKVPKSLKKFPTLRMFVFFSYFRQIFRNARSGKIKILNLSFKIHHADKIITMSSLLQLKAQYESLANQYSQNLTEATACLARNDEGIFSLCKKPL